MEIYLIRHTRPAVAKGICYGQADIGVTESFLEEATIIQQHLPSQIEQVFSSPLQRCTTLAAHLFPGHTIQLHDDLKEINCGDWELLPWDDIPKSEVEPWLKDILNVRIPNGENYVDVYKRVIELFDQLCLHSSPTAIFAHGGVIRSILAYVTGTSLIDSFSAFSLHYGCVIRITAVEHELKHEVLSNIPHEKETHKPSYYSYSLLGGK